MGRGYQGRPFDNDILHLLGMRERIKRMFDEDLGGEEALGLPSGSNWTPPVDIMDAGDEYVLTAEIPGVDEQSIELEVVGDALMLQGERPRHVVAQGVAYHRIERPEGPFRRSFRLPDEIDSSGIKAVMKDGVLVVNIPKSGQSASLTVCVEVEE